MRQSLSATKDMSLKTAAYFNLPRRLSPIAYSDTRICTNVISLSAVWH